MVGAQDTLSSMMKGHCVISLPATYLTLEKGVTRRSVWLCKFPEDRGRSPILALELPRAGVNLD